jgi:hypothetical protein
VTSIVEVPNSEFGVLTSTVGVPSLKLVQCGRNNPPVKKGSKAYCKSNIPSALEPPYFCLLALAASTSKLGVHT